MHRGWPDQTSILKVRFGVEGLERRTVRRPWQTTGRGLTEAAIQGVGGRRFQILGKFLKVGSAGIAGALGARKREEGLLHFVLFVFGSGNLENGVAFF